MATTENYRGSGGGDALERLSDSDGFDRRLFGVETRVGIAHCDALFHAGILTRAEAERIKNGLQALSKRAGYDGNYFSELRAADIQEFTDARLAQLVGETARKLNVGRSARDREATVLRLWLKEEIEKLSILARVLQKALVAAAERAGEAVIIISGGCGGGCSFSQPILLAHWCLAYFETTARDRERLDEVWRRVNVSPLGAGDGAGVNFEIDREETARGLGFEGVSPNSFDAVSDDDYAVEFVAACAIIGAHLARLADDLLALAAEEFAVVKFSAMVGNSFSEAKTLRALRSIRSQSARVFGHQAALFSSAFRGAEVREKQSAVFGSADTIEICLRAATAVLDVLSVEEKSARGAAIKNRALDAELRDYLLHKDLPYQAACAAVEKIVAFAAEKAIQINEISLAQMQSFSAQIEADVFAALNLEQSIAAKSQIGGTAPERVADALDAARRALEMEE